MGMLGYVKDGKYVAVSGDFNPERQFDNPQFKQGDHDRQRKDFAKEILQPYNKDGSVNQDFVEAYPDIAKEDGLVPKGDE